MTRTNCVNVADVLVTKLISHLVDCIHFFFLNNYDFFFLLKKTRIATLLLFCAGIDWLFLVVEYQKCINSKLLYTTAGLHPTKNSDRSFLLSLSHWYDKLKPENKIFSYCHVDTINLKPKNKISLSHIDTKQHWKSKNKIGCKRFRNLSAKFNIHTRTGYISVYIFVSDRCNEFTSTRIFARYSHANRSWITLETN